MYQGTVTSAISVTSVELSSFGHIREEVGVENKEARKPSLCRVAVGEHSAMANRTRWDLKVKSICCPKQPVALGCAQASVQDLAPFSVQLKCKREAESTEVTQGYVFLSLFCVGGIAKVSVCFDFFFLFFSFFF